MDGEQAAEMGRRRKRSKAERRAIVEETMQPGMSVARVALAHGINANQVFSWRKMYREGGLKEKEPKNGLLPVKVSGGPAKLEALRRGGTSPVRNGIIDIDLGHAQVRIEGNADPECVRAVLEGLLP
jgi:transposase